MKSVRLFLQLDRRQPMKAAEGFGKAFRSFVSVFISKVNHLIVPCQDIQGCEIQASVTQISSNCHSGNDFKALLKIKRGDTHLPRNIIRSDILQQMIFHIIDGLLHCFQPFHFPFSLQYMSSFPPNFVLTALTRTASYKI